MDDSRGKSPQVPTHITIYMNLIGLRVVLTIVTFIIGIVHDNNLGDRSTKVSPKFITTIPSSKKDDTVQLLL
jgi:hypothetical protein